MHLVNALYKSSYLFQVCEADTIMITILQIYSLIHSKNVSGMSLMCQTILYGRNIAVNKMDKNPLCTFK